MISTDDKLWDRLKKMKDPSSNRDIVSSEVVKQLRLDGSVVSVQLAPPESDIYIHQALAEAIRHELVAEEGIEKVRVTWPSPGDSNPDALTDSNAIPLPILENAQTPPPDGYDDPSMRVGIAPEIGYNEWGPDALPAPDLEIPDEPYEAWPPVLQWDIDPTDTSLNSGEEHARIGKWDYEIWWQAHPDGIIYAALQALKDDSVTTGHERQHPMGRNVVVNIVYDERRNAVVAVYGTARDFRPFIEAFRIGYGLEQPIKESVE